MADAPEDPKPRRSVTDAIGGWARRVTDLVAEVSGSPSVPKELEEPLGTLRTRRFDGDADGAVTAARELLATHPDSMHLQLALGLGALHQLALGGRPTGTLEGVIVALGENLGAGPLQLLQGGARLAAGEPEKALDELRRAARDPASAAKEDEPEIRLLAHLLSALAQLARGEEERALRELHKARSRLPATMGAPIRELVLRHGVMLLLAADRIPDAETWARDALRRDEKSPLAQALVARVYAAKGDKVGAQAMLDELSDDNAHDLTRLYVGLGVGLPDDQDPLQTVALRYLQADSSDPARRRVWALVELSRRDADVGTPFDAGVAQEILTALADAAEHAPAGSRDRHLAELAHVALRIDATAPRVATLIEARLDRDAGTAPEELRIFRARRRIAAGADAIEDFIVGPPLRFRADPDVGGVHGPDPLSPVRDADLRHSIRASQRALAGAELSLRSDQRDAAQDLLVEALIEWPRSQRARRLLSELAHPTGANRLEDLLAGATTLLAAVPNRILGISLGGVQDALAQVIAARERLARPLTIAIMGEFSAGKSTFVNALLGEAIAPMGVLPTTTTINVFRKGPGGGAQVHYRDGRIATLAAEDINSFLHGLDTEAATRIRHVEIERTGPRMGEAAVVDTPGLNALDPFHEQVAREFLDEADAVIWLFSATRTGAATEVGMLENLRAGGRRVLGVLNKVDTLEADEKEELATYLRDQLGEVLVDVVPLCARDALEYRTEGHGGDDPFAEVERALEREFLQRARELKRTVTVRRFSDALTAARTATERAVGQLEVLAEEGLAGARKDRPPAYRLLVEFADAVEREVLALDDLLTREGLGLGVLVARKGRGSKGPLDPLDDEYLAAVVREGLTDALRRALAEVGRRDPSAGAVLDQVFVSWAQGHIEGLLDAGFISDTLDAHSGKIADGEAAMRAGLREALRPVARAWARRARLLVREVERARNRDDRAASSAPRAEALRLRASVLTSVDALQGGVDALQEPAG
jgi:GTP-binding protein EngB required for normal cell division